MHGLVGVKDRMKGEAISRIRTMRDIKTDPDITRAKKIKTTHSLSRTEQEMESLDSIEDKHLEQALDKERRRFARQDAAVERTQKKLLDTRVNLARMLNKNRRVTELRHELQRSRYKRKDPKPVGTTKSPPRGNSNRKAAPSITSRGWRKVTIDY